MSHFQWLMVNYSWTVAYWLPTELCMSWWILRYKKPIHINIIWVCGFTFCLLSAQTHSNQNLWHVIWIRLYSSLSLCFPVTGSVLPKQDMNSPSGSSFFMLFINTFRSSNRIFRVQIFSVWVWDVLVWYTPIFFGTFHFLSSFLRASFIFEYSLRFGFNYMVFKITHMIWVISHESCYTSIWRAIEGVCHQLKTLPYSFWRKFNFFFDIVSVARNCWHCWRHHSRRLFNRCRLEGGLCLYRDYSVPWATAMLARLYLGKNFSMLVTDSLHWKS